MFNLNEIKGEENKVATLSKRLEMFIADAKGNVMLLETAVRMTKELITMCEGDKDERFKMFLTVHYNVLTAKITQTKLLIAETEDAMKGGAND